MRSPKKMKTKKILSHNFNLLLIALLFIALVVFGSSKLLNTVYSHITKAKQSEKVPLAAHQHAVATIDGSVDPSLIPDHKAFSLLFRFISGRSEETEKRLVRIYIKQMGLTDADTETLVTTAEEFRLRVTILDHQAKDLHERSRMNSGLEVLSQLKQLEEQKETFVAELVASLPTRLGPDGMQNLRRYINDRFKRQMKIVPSSTQAN